MRAFRFSTRNPLVGALILMLLLALVAAVVVFGVALLAGAAAVAAVVGVGGALLRRGRRGALPRTSGEARFATRADAARTVARGLDPSREVFPESARDERRLPPTL